MSREELIDETRKKISESQKRRLNNEEEVAKMYKPIWQYEENGVLVKKYNSVKEASKETMFSKSSISAASRGILNKEGNHKLGKFLFFNTKL